MVVVVGKLIERIMIIWLKCSIPEILTEVLYSTMAKLLKFNHYVKGSKIELQIYANVGASLLLAD